MNSIHLLSMTALTALPWTSLRAFEAASRLGSFKEAARELSVTPTAISHQIRRLETYLGLALFDRLHRSLQLTLAGEALAEEAQGSFLRLGRTLDNLRLEGRVAGPHTLTVSVVPSFATKWLAPRLHDFQFAHPKIGLRIVADETLVDLRRDRVFDLAVRYGPGPHGSGLHAKRLWPHGEIIAVCAPELARDHSLRSPAGLAQHMLIRTDSPGYRIQAKRARPTSDWLAWFAAAGVEVTDRIRKALEGPYFNASQLAIEAAVSGKGIALAPKILVDRDIANGRLVRLFATSIKDPNAYWILCRADRAREARIRAFIKWLSDEASKS
ncbi:MAG TPA: LysR substrate-binding domain-containing protein [Dongiaceae bacterium]|jgi:DNA-binding transcriptional LysR family regulator|nr:LysR substrate-binding domain-containing protein [Dongiaceae bacterium]